MDSNYIIFYSAEGKFKSKWLHIIHLNNWHDLDDFFTLGDDPKDPHTKIKYHVKIDISNLEKINNFR